MANIKVIRDFRDRQNGLILRKIGDEFEVKKERADELVKLGFAEIVKESKNK